MVTIELHSLSDDNIVTEVNESDFKISKAEGPDILSPEQFLRRFQMSNDEILKKSYNDDGEQNFDNYTNQMGTSYQQGDWPIDANNIALVDEKKYFSVGQVHMRIAKSKNSTKKKFDSEGYYADNKWKPDTDFDTCIED